MDELRAENNTDHIKIKADIELNANKLTLTRDALDTLRAENNIAHEKL